MIVPEGVSGIAFGSAADGNPRTDATARGRASTSLGIPDAWAWVRQVHQAEVIHALTPGVVGEADGVFTTDPALPVAVAVADCLPIGLLAGGAAGMAHAGWRGVVSGVVAATIDAMSAAGYPPHTAVIGPGIGPCCFEVGPEVAERFPGHVSTTTWGTTSVDLRGAVAETLGGIEVVSVPAACTHHDSGFHSFRATGTQDRQFGVAWIPPA